MEFKKEVIMAGPYHHIVNEDILKAVTIILEQHDKIIKANTKILEILCPPLLEIQKDGSLGYVK